MQHARYHNKTQKAFTWLGFCYLQTNQPRKAGLRLVMAFFNQVRAPRHIFVVFVTNKVKNKATIVCFGLRARTPTWKTRTVSNSILMRFFVDRYLKLWDLNTGVPVSLLTGHLESVRCLQFTGNALVCNYITLEPVWCIVSSNRHTFVKLTYSRQTGDSKTGGRGHYWSERHAHFFSL